MDSNKKGTRIRFSINEKDFIGDDYLEFKSFRSYVRIIFIVFLCIFIVWFIERGTFKEEVEGYYTPSYENVKITSYVDRFDDKGESTMPRYQINGICKGSYISLRSTNNDLMDIVDSVGELTGRKLKYKVGNTYKMNVSPTNQVGVTNGVVIFDVIFLFASLGCSVILTIISLFNIFDSDWICSRCTRTKTLKARIFLFTYEVLSLLIPSIFTIYYIKWIYFWATI